ncbi:MAG TPA: DUF6158 family protein [Natronosporangium sp.]|jgi:hypothetical protein|nr:DUF6158 family protein [Natronosporangium sp.]
MANTENSPTRHAGPEPGSVLPADRVPASELSHDDLMRELATVHRTRHDTLRHGSDQALAHHDQRMRELEREYLRRFPEREIDPDRLTAGARARAESFRTGAEQPWDPEDLAIAEGRDPTPENVAWARRKLAEEGPAAIDRTVP